MVILVIIFLLRCSAVISEASITIISYFCYSINYFWHDLYIMTWKIYSKPVDFEGFRIYVSIVKKYIKKSCIFINKIFIVNSIRNRLRFLQFPYSYHIGKQYKPIVHLFESISHLLCQHLFQCFYPFLMPHLSVFS